MKNSFKAAIVFVAFLSVIIVATSCASHGYGCHGRSKIITRVK